MHGGPKVTVLRVQFREQTFRLPLADGMQVVRLDEDSLDYDWKGDDGRFHGSLPYENLRPHNRVTRKGTGYQTAAVISGALLIASFIAAAENGDSFVRWVGPLLGVTFFYSLKRSFAPAVTCIQIEPQSYGFNDTLAVPNSKAGRAFLDALLSAWTESLKRRFLPTPTELQHIGLQRLDWLEHVGALSATEADQERSRILQEGEIELVALTGERSEIKTN